MAKKSRSAHAHEQKKHSEHKIVHENKKMDLQPILIGIIAVLAIILLFVGYNVYMKDKPVSVGGNDNPVVGGSGKAKLEFYVMSQCPYGTQVVDAIQPVLKKLGNNVDFQMNFIGTDSGNGVFTSLHGQNEVDGDKVQLCAAKYNPDTYMDMIVCMNKDARSIPNNWELCAKDNSLDVEKIKSCYTGDEGNQLLSASFKKAQDANAGGSPTMFLNGQPYQGGRDELSFQRALCNNIKDHPACASIPACGTDADCTAEVDKIGKCENPNQANAKCNYIEPVKVNMIILNDKKCSSCDASQITTATQRIFKGAVIKTVDVSSAEGKKLIAELGIKVVPAYIFDNKLPETDGWQTNAQLQQVFDKIGSYYKIKDAATGATHFVDEKAQKEFMAKIGVTLGDNKPQIDFFVMSYCPYGNQAEEIVEPVYQKFKDKAEFNPRYVIYSNYQGGGPNYCIDKESKYCSMHGIQELNQNVREMCVDKYLGVGSWFKFALAMNKDCSAQNADSCWEKVATSLSLDTKKIKDCFDKEALSLLKAELELGNALGVQGSPTIFVEGEEFGGARTVGGYMGALCSKFDKAPSECDNIPKDAPATAAAAPSGGCG